MFNYYLPNLVDGEGNDEPEVYVKEIEGKEYPKFLYFDPDQKLLTFRPDDVWDKGKPYYFQIVVKEKNSDVNVNAFFCTAKIWGALTTDEDVFDYTDVTFKMYGDKTKKSSRVDSSSSTGIEWSLPVNTTFIAEHFDDIFKVYIRNITYRELHTDADVLKKEFTEMNQTHMNISFTFWEPYMLGLMHKKEDRLFVAFKHDILDTTGRFIEEYKYLNGMFFN